MEINAQTYYNELSRGEKRSMVLKLAEECHIHPNTVILYLRGKKKPGPLTAVKMAETIGIPANQLFPTVEL